MLRRSAPRHPYTPLIGITYNGNGTVASGKHHHNLVLRLIRILILVDENVAEPLSIVLQDVAVLAKQSDDVDQQIVEVHCSGPQQTRLVLGVDICVLSVEDILGLVGHLFGSDEFISS